MCELMGQLIKVLLRSKLMRKFYRLPYILSVTLNYCFPGKAPKYDLVFVLPDNGKGWILDGICREIAARYIGNLVFHYGTGDLPSSTAYFFSHYWLLKSAILKQPILWDRRKYVWFTHPKKELGISDAELAYLLNLTNMTICTCFAFEKMLIELGVDKTRLTTVLGAADPSLFTFHERGGNTVGFSSAYYERKCPDKMLGIMQSMPDMQFILLGRGWDRWDKFEKMLTLKNFEYVETEYANYPQYYRKMDIFVSTSVLEGGPIPLIEAMMANIFPVVSDTGFARDIIHHGENGFIFPVDSDISSICELIRQARMNTTNIRETVINLSWENFSKNIISLFG